ncbi:MAG TPA: divalent-cation tolerance protein CutA [Planctomycetota bacterium]|jgi:periplasmic divalent cation tolerance protein
MAKKKAAGAGSVRVVLVTAPVKEAETLARTLVEERLAACANLLPGVTSLYWWEGKINRDAEVLIVLKTRKTGVARLMKRVKELHSYTVPEFLTLEVREGNADYVKWVGTEVR